MTALDIVRARVALGHLLSGHNIPEALQPLLLQAHDALLAEERRDPEGQAKAFAMLGNDEWMIG